MDMPTKSTQNTKVLITVSDNCLEAVISMLQNHVKHLYCDFLKNASLFSIPTYVPITPVLDEKDNEKYFLENVCNQ